MRRTKIETLTKVHCQQCNHHQALNPLGELTQWEYSMVADAIRWKCDSCGHEQPLDGSEGWPAPDLPDLTQDDGAKAEDPEAGRGPGADPDRENAPNLTQANALEVVSNAHPAARQQGVVDYLTELTRLADAGEVVGFAVIAIRPNGTMFHHWDAAQLHYERLCGRMAIMSHQLGRELVDDLRPGPIDYDDPDAG